MKIIKETLKILNTYPDHNEMVEHLPECWKDGKTSPAYNKLTAHKQYRELRALPVGGRDFLYVKYDTVPDYDYKENKALHNVRKINKSSLKIITWTGTRVSKNVRCGQRYACGFCKERYNITFWLFNGHKFTGMFSPNSGDYIRVKRVA